MLYRVFFIKKSGLISWQDCDTIDDCIAVAKDQKQEVDVYSQLHKGVSLKDVWRYFCTIEVIE